jgi:transcriptional regulator GlxA family with amidase domain
MDSRINIGFVLFPRFTGLDLIGPHEILSRAFTSCILVSKTLEVVKSDGNISVVPDFTFVDCPKLDVLVVPGGPGQSEAIEDNELINFIEKKSCEANWVAGICTGVLLLAKASVLTGKPSTTHWLAIGELEKYGSIPIHERYVWSDNIITGAGVSSGIDLSLSLVQRIFGDEEAQRIQLAIEYDPCPPFNTGTPNKAPYHLVEKLKATSRFH